MNDEMTEVLSRVEGIARRAFSVVGFSVRRTRLGGNSVCLVCSGEFSFSVFCCVDSPGYMVIYSFFADGFFLAIRLFLRMFLIF